MKLTKELFVAAVIGSLSVTYCARADDPNQPVADTHNEMEHHDNMDDDTIKFPHYRQQEIDVDLYGSSSLGEETVENLSGSRFRHHVLYGGGGGLTFFFMRYVGVGGEFDADARAHRFVDNASGNVYIRFPIPHTGVAPYIFGGGGYQFEEIRQSFAQGGGGMEFRFCNNVGIFVDGRWVFCADTEDHALVRAGVRLSF